MAVIDTLAIRVVTNAKAVAPDMMKVGSAIRTVGVHSTKAAPALQLVGNALEVIGPGGRAAAAGRGLVVVGDALRKISERETGGRATSFLRDAFGWVVRLGSWVIPGGTAFKILVAGTGVLGIMKTRKAIKETSSAIDQMADRLDRLTKVGQRLNIGAAELAGLRHAALSTAGVMNGQFDTAMQRLVRRVSEAKLGGGEAKKVIDELGLSAADLSKLSADKQFLAVADAMQKVRHQSDRLRIAAKLFDTEGAAVVTTLALGSARIEQLMREAQELGVAPTNKAAKAAEAYASQVERTAQAWRGVGDRINGALLPLKAFGSKLSEIEARMASGLISLYPFRLARGVLARGARDYFTDPIAGKLSHFEQGTHNLRLKVHGGTLNGTNLSPLAKGLGAGGGVGRNELAAREAGSLDTFAAARRNLRDNPSHFLKAIVAATEETARQLKKQNKPQTTGPPVFSMAGS